MISTCVAIAAFSVNRISLLSLVCVVTAPITYFTLRSKKSKKNPLPFKKKKKKAKSTHSERDSSGTIQSDSLHIKEQ